MIKTTECCLCSQLAGESCNDLIARLLPAEIYVRRVMWESESFAAIPSLGPLTSGHTLLCPKLHVRSFAQLESRLHDEYEVAKQTLRLALARQYGSSLHIFEHGMAATGDRIVCSTDHAHMHFVPLPEACRVDDSDQPAWTEFDGTLKALVHLAGGGEYIYYERPDNTRLLFVGKVESQLMRKVFARALGRGESWNWRADPNATAADHTWRHFSL